MKKSAQTPINGRPKRRPQLPTAAEDAAFAFEERVLRPGGEAARSAGGELRRGADGAVWAFERRLLWPLQDRLREMGGPARAITGAAVMLLAVAVGVAALLWAASGGSHGAATPTTQVADTAKTQVSAPAPAPERERPAPTLHGAAPVFKAPQGESAGVGSARGVEKAPEPEPETSATGATASAAGAASAYNSAATGTISSSPQASTSSAQTSTVNGPPAGPAALAVAHEFANAFVRYEIGATDAKVRTAFHASASRELARELLRRPPKQPATVKVPKAKVVNVVAAPSSGSVYPVSVSLLRVGVTSELRLEMEQTRKDGWQVVNVLG